MAFNWKTFTTRASTAVIFVAVMLAGLLVNHWSFLILFSIVHFGCWWEYLKLIERIHNTSFHTYTKLGWMLLGYGLVLMFCGSYYHIGDYGLKENFSLPLSLAGFVMLTIGVLQKEVIRPKAFGAAALGLLYISLSWGLMIDMYAIETVNPGLLEEKKILKVFFPLIIIGCMWINDTMAYIVGSIIGRTPLTKISPKKTWEGTSGGIILGSIIMGLIGYLADGVFIFGQSISFWITLALVAATVGTIGDLLESKLKRMANVKDSGSLMPGHGGFLDRFDSLLLATPFAWVYIYFFL